jgi:Flp pilus assembly protein TadD
LVHVDVDCPDGGELVEAALQAGGVLVVPHLAGAEREYREAIRLNPLTVETHYNLGLVYEAKGDLAGAEREFREAIKLDPTGGDADAHRSLAGVLRAKKGARAEKI